ncbi:hsp70 nucleotide exchange factor fes1 [Dimargaris cristalligena]|uniref:Armadillo-type protein n=1 Tax=Dimargaris cristalligena TaxID=215637 RepID=A0A4Q0A1D1_9FUNG|nr:hsp70 nucleotide exchange factor fes1 [Dimargaris cristalligena]RKP38950.1 armadillo-type protein [Dimargaris cristalligena]|eukprot:RKP38950.1 armadillo-type protein [Dimargaris cristalligena]
MDKLLKWAVLNSATANEDAPATTQPRPDHQKLDPAIIDHILGKDESVLMREAMAVIQNPNLDWEAKEIAFEDLELLVSHIDNANNLVPLQLWGPLMDLLQDPDPRMRSNAAWILGTSLQNNPKAQRRFQEDLATPMVEGGGGLLRVLPLLQADQPVAVQDKALFCISAYVRQFPPGLQQLIELRGLEMLKLVVEDPARAGKLKRRIYFFLATLLNGADTYGPTLAQRLRKDRYLELLVEQIPQLLEAGELDTLDHALRLLVALHDHDASLSLAKTLKENPALWQAIQKIGQSPARDGISEDVWDKIKSIL